MTPIRKADKPFASMTRQEVHDLMAPTPLPSEGECICGIIDDGCITERIERSGCPVHTPTTSMEKPTLEGFRAWLRSRDYADADSEIDAYIASKEKEDGTTKPTCPDGNGMVGGADARSDSPSGVASELTHTSMEKEDGKENSALLAMDRDNRTDLSQVRNGEGGMETDGLGVSQVRSELTPSPIQEYENERNARELYRCDCFKEGWFKRYRWNPECPSHGGFDTPQETIDRLVREREEASKEKEDGQTGTDISGDMGGVLPSDGRSRGNDSASATLTPAPIQELDPDDPPWPRPHRIRELTKWLIGLARWVEQEHVLTEHAAKMAREAAAALERIKGENYALKSVASRFEEKCNRLEVEMAELSKNLSPLHRYDELAQAQETIAALRAYEKRWRDELSEAQAEIARLKAGWDACRESLWQAREAVELLTKANERLSFAAIGLPAR